MINNENVPKEELRIKGLKLMRSGVVVNLQNWLQIKSYLINVQSLIDVSQRLKLLNYLSLHSPDIIFLTETWLYPSIEDSEIFHEKAVIQQSPDKID